MQFDVKIRNVIENGKPLKALASVTVDGSFTIHNVRVNLNISFSSPPIIHHNYEYFYPPSIDLDYEGNRRLFCLQKKFSRNFSKTPPKNALPFQTSEGVNSEPRKCKPFTCTLTTE